LSSIIALPLPQFPAAIVTKLSKMDERKANRRMKKCFKKKKKKKKKKEEKEKEKDNNDVWSPT